MSFPRYPTYKDSGVEWLGEVPGHWQIPLIKHTTYLKARVGWKGLTSEEFKEQSFAYLVTGSDFREKFVRWDACYQVEQERYEDDPFIKLRNGDLLITKDGTIGKLAIVSNLDRPACLNSGIFVARPLNTYTTEFMYWILSSKVFSVFCDLESFGSTINHLYQNVFERFAFPAPPVAEQNQIVDFLDRETAKIDALVAEQRRLMELLKEKRQAVISHAVTQGLNPDVPMKPSGVEWLGDVPEHWEVTKMKWVAEMQSGHTPDKKVPAYWENGDIPWVSLNDTGYLKDHDYITETAYSISQAGIDNSSARLLPPRVVVFSRDATIGRCAITTRPMAVSQHFIAWVCGDSMIPEFLLLRLRSMTGELDRLTTGATLKTIGMPDVRTIVTPVPPVQEQQAIIDWVNSEATRIDTLTTEAQRAIDLLQERRTALISAAVTGQIDVRTLTAKEAA